MKFLETFKEPYESKGLPRNKWWEHWAANKKACWPFYLPWKLPLPTLLHQRQLCPSQGISSFVAFTSTSTRWPSVDKSDFSSTPTSRGEPGVQGLRHAGSSGGSSSSSKQQRQQEAWVRPEAQPWKTSATWSPTMSSCPCWASVLEPRRGMCE